MNDPEHCAQCGAALPADLGPAICPACELRGALNPEEPPVVAPFEARTLGDYDLLEEIGRGGMGVVYKARQRSLNRMVAVKLLPGSLLGRAGSLRRFQAEAIATAALRHPGIVAIHEVGVHDGQHYLAMELVSGPNLAQAATGLQFTRADFHRVARWMRGVAEAVHHAHERGILHRDLKPSNILLDQDDQPRITDFGLAKRLEETGDHARDAGSSTAAASLTLSGQVLGSPNYIPPEQANALRRCPVDRRSDVYSLGATLYHLLTGQAPFRASSLTEVLQLVMQREPVAPRFLQASVPVDLETICLKCLEKEPARRYSTAQALVEELDRFLRGEPIQARPAGYVEKSVRWCRRNPAWAALTVAATLLTVAVLTSLSLAGLRNAAVRRAEQREYFAAIMLADNYVRMGDIPRALEMLTNCPPAHRHWEWGRLMYLCHQDISSLDVVTNKVSVVGGVEFLHAIVNRDRSRLITVSEDGTATAWALPSGAKQFAVGGSGRRVVDMAFAPDDRTLALLDRNGGVQIWDALAGRPGLDLPAVRSGARAIRFGPDGATIVVTGSDRAVTLDAGTGQAIAATPSLVSTGAITRVTLSPDGMRVATLDENRRARLWDAVTGELLRTFEGIFPAEGQLYFSPNGRRLLIGAVGNGMSTVWNTVDGQRTAQLRVPVEFATFNSDGSRICILSGDNVASIWSTGSSREILSLKGHAATVRYAVFSSNDLQVTTVDESFVVKTWRAGPGREYIRSSGLNEGLVFSPDGSQLALTQDDDDITVWNVESGALVHRLQGHLQRTLKVAFSPDGKRLYSCSHDKTVRIWNLESGALERTMRGFSNLLTTLTLSPDGRTLVTAGDGVRLWSTVSNAPSRLLIGATNDEYVIVAFRPDGGQLASTHMAQGTRLWDPEGGLLRTLPGHPAGIMGLAYSPDNRTLATGGFDKQIHVWDCETGRRIRTLQTPFKVYAVHFSPDGRRLLTATGEHRRNFAHSTAQIWDVESGRELLALEGHASQIHCATFSPDGRRAATVDWSGTLRVWETFPWRSEDYPGLASTPLPARARQYADEYWRQRMPVDGWATRVGGTPTTGQLRRVPRSEFAMRPPGATSRQLDLTDHYNALLNVSWIPTRFIDAMGSDLSLLRTGLVEFAGTTFDVRGLIQVQGPLNNWLNHESRLLPERIEGIPVAQPVRRLHALLGAIGREPDGTVIGAFRLHDVSGVTRELPIRYGEHVRDWWSGEDTQDTLTAGTVVWRGSTMISRPGATTTITASWICSWPTPATSSPTPSTSR